MALNQLGLGMVFTATDLASGVMKKVQQGFSQTRDEAGRFQALSKNLFDQFGAGAKAFGAGLLTMGAFAPAIIKSTQFEHSLANLRTVIDESRLSTEDAKAATMGLAATYGSDAIKQADALYETISSGVEDAGEALKLLGVANRFAVGGNADMGKSIDVLTSAVNVYREKGLSAAQASDIMFTAIAAGKTTADQLSKYLGEVAPTAQAAGVGFDELNAAIATLTVQGIRTPQAVTGLNAMLSNLMTPSSNAAKEAKRLGIEFNATALKTMGLKGVLSQLIGNSKMTNDSMGQLFGSIDGIKAALALTSGDGKKFDEVLGQMGSSAGATDRAFAIMSKTTKFQADRFKALGTNALLLIGDALEPLRVKVLSFANAVLEGFGKIPKPILETGVRMVALVAGVVSLAGAVTMLKSGLQIGALAMRAFGMSAGGGLLATFGPALAIIALAAAGIYAFRYAVDNNLGGLGERFGGTFSQIKLAFTAIGQLFTDGGFSGEVRDAFNEGGNGAINFAIQVYVVAGRIKGFLEGIAEGFGQTMDTAGPIFEQLGNAFERVGTALGMVSVSTSENAAAFDGAKGSGASFGATIAKVGIFLAQVVTNVLNFAAGVARVWDTMSEPFGRLWDSLGQVFGALGQLMGALFASGDATDSTAADWVTMGERIGGAVAGIAGVVSGVVSGIAGVISALAVIVEGVIDVIVGTLNGDGAQAWNGFKKIAFGAISGIMEALGGLLEAVASAIDGLGALAGKDLGFGKKVNSFRDYVRSEAAGLRPDGTQAGQALFTPAPIGPPPPPGFPPSPAGAAMPALAGPTQGFESLGPQLATAMSKQKPSNVTVPITLQVGPDVVAQMVAKATPGGDGRDFTPGAPSQ
jgi:TP901 family phage tail tape measure protein